MTITTVYICTTCDQSAQRQDSPLAQDGKQLLKNMRQFAKQQNDAAVKIKGVKCMGGCNRACAVGVTAPNKQAVLFVDMAPDAPQDVWAIVQAHQQSRIGRVLYKHLPAHLRGRFLARVPQPVRK